MLRISDKYVKYILRNPILIKVVFTIIEPKPKEKRPP